LQTIFLPRLVIFNSPGRFTAHRCSQPKASRTAAALKVSGNRVWPTWPMDLSRFLSSKAAAAPPVYPAPSHETNEPAAQQATSGACGGRAGGERRYGGVKERRAYRCPVANGATEVEIALYGVGF
jgi:hypothetical protein